MKEAFSEPRPFALVRVPFPLSDPHTPKRRAGLVLSTTGLQQPCRVRLTLFTLDKRRVPGTLGRLAAIDQLGLKRQLRALLPDLSDTDRMGPEQPPLSPVDR